MNGKEEAVRKATQVLHSEESSIGEFIRFKATSLPKITSLPKRMSFWPKTNEGIGKYVEICCLVLSAALVECMLSPDG